MITTERIAMVGQGDVGLPLAVEFTNHQPVKGFDVKRERIAVLEEGCEYGQNFVAEPSSTPMAVPFWRSHMTSIV